MADTPEDREDDPTLNDRLLDALVFVPAGLAITVVEELPRLAERGRDRLGVRVSSARAVGQFAVRAGRDEFVRRAAGLWPRGGPAAAPGPREPSPDPAHDPGTAGGGPAAPPPARGPAVNGHVPAVSTLAIPGFDTLSASQVVQRLDGLNRTELVSVRAYEASTRGRRTILNRVDQLLDERS